MMLALFIFSNVNVANAKTEVARVYIDYLKITLDDKGNYYAMRADWMRPAQSISGKYDILEDSWQTKGYKIYNLSSPVSCLITIKSDMTAMIQGYGANKGVPDFSVKWSKISNSNKLEVEIRMKMFTLFDDYTGLESESRETPISWSRVSSNEFQITISNQIVNLFRYNDGTALLDGLDNNNKPIRMSGTWSGTINPISTSTQVPIQTIRVTPTPLRILIPLLLLCLLVGVGYWIIQKRKSKKQAQIEKEISRSSTEKADKEIKEPVKADTAFKPEHKAMPFKSKQPELETLTKGVDVKTAFGYKGATILYKLKVENNTSDPISDIKVYPYVPDVFLLKEKEKSIALIEPGSSQTVTFDIRPTGECGECNISGRVNYYDLASRKRLDIELEPKSLSIICPMLHGKEISEAQWHDAVSNLVKAEENTKEIDMPAETLFTMVSRIVKDMHMYMQKPEVTQNQRLFNGVARFYGEGVKGLRYAAQVEVVGGEKKSRLLLKAWAEKEDALTGFYHGILDEIEKRVNVKGYIDDSIVQQYIHLGDKIGTQVKDSFVQRSNIGAGAWKCPKCGRDVEANEKFCLECGEKL